MSPTHPQSGVLVLGPNALQSLVPSTLISQVESLLDSHRIEDAVDLADRRRKKLQESVSLDGHELDELRYVYQRIGFQYFTETLFEDAGKHLFNGQLDPCVLVSYYPELHGSFFGADDSIHVFTGVAEHMPTEASIDDIIRNYSPHLAPNTRSAPPTAELRKMLGIAAKEMLEVFLMKWRIRWNVNEAIDVLLKKPVNPSLSITDTVLARLYSEAKKIKELYALLQEPNHVVVADLEPVLKANGHYNALCMLYKARQDDLKLLEVWSRLIEGQWEDEDIKDPVSDMISLLAEKRDKELTQYWGVWLTKRDLERGLAILMTPDTSRRKERLEEDLALLEQIKDANPVAESRYLEYLVLQRRSLFRELHIQLAATCVEQLSAAISRVEVWKLWRAKAASYATSRSENSFLSYFASTTPDSTHKLVRLKTILFLAGSSLYDPQLVRPRLLQYQNILTLELAIVDGKLGNHRSALATLVHDLHDGSSAEAYCTLGGSIVPMKIAQSIAETCGLQQWVSALYPHPSPTAKSSPVSIYMSRQAEMDEWVKKGLPKILLEVYLSDEETRTNRAARFLDSHAINLDVLDVLPIVPQNWSLNMMSSFLARSYRRTLHTRHEGKIIKTISAGQNLEVKERAWLILREEAMVLEEPPEDEDDGHDQSCDEKGACSEKIALQWPL